jgi:hypothetical protein
MVIHQGNVHRHDGRGQVSPTFPFSNGPGQADTAPYYFKQLFIDRNLLSG